MNNFRILSRGLANVVTRVVLTALDSAKKCQAASVQLVGGDEKRGVEYLEPYGFTSAPLAGAEGVALFPGGDRSHGVVISLADRRYRLTALQPGEVAIYTDEGDSVILKRGRVAEINTDQLIVNAKTKVSFNTPLIECSGDYKGAGEVADGVGTMSAMRTTYNGHTHKENGDGGGTTDAPGQAMG